MNKHIEQIELRSEEVQEILTKVPHWMIRWGNSVFFLLIILLLALSWFIKYPDIINSDAIITTEIPPEKEYARASGKIDTIFVNDGQEILKREPLAIIENTANYQDVFFLKSIIDSITIQKQAFYFPIEKMPILFLGDIENKGKIHYFYNKFDLYFQLLWLKYQYPYYSRNYYYDYVDYQNVKSEFTIYGFLVQSTQNIVKTVRKWINSN